MKWVAGRGGDSSQFKDGNGHQNEAHQPKQKGLALLLEAYDYAHHVGRPLWDFALEAQVLRNGGLTENDFRWLTCKGYVKHAHEDTRSGQMARRFRPSGGLVFSEKTCFILTAAGVDFLRSRQHPHVSPITRPLMGDSARPFAEPSENGSQSEIVVPVWDADRRELRFRGILVKRFRLPSRNQVHILMAFEEEHWPTRIDDPLPPNPMTDSKLRLRETIRSLNRNQKELLLHFAGDGTGEGVIWAPHESNQFHL